MNDQQQTDYQIRHTALQYAQSLQGYTATNSQPHTAESLIAAAAKIEAYLREGKQATT